MKNCWRFFTGMLVCVVTAVAFVGCSGGGTTPTSFKSSTTPALGTVKLRMSAGSFRAVGMPIELQATFQEISLLNPDTGDTTPAPHDWLSDYTPLNPNIPIPMLQGTTLIDLFTNGAPPNYTAVTTQQVPAQLYTKIRLILDPDFEEALKELPFDFSKIKTIVPITGGMQVNPGGSVNLLVDFLSGSAQVVPN